MVFLPGGLTHTGSFALWLLPSSVTVLFIQTAKDEEMEKAQLASPENCPDMTCSSPAHRPSAGTASLDTWTADRLDWELKPCLDHASFQHTLMQMVYRSLVTSYRLCCLISKEIENNWQTLCFKLFYSSSLFVGCVA